MSKKRNPKNNYIRKTNRTRRKTTRTRRKTTRTRRKTNLKRRNKRSGLLSGLLSGGSGGDEVSGAGGADTGRKVRNRIGFELEACFRGKKTPGSIDDDDDDDRECDAINNRDSLIELFGKELNYFKLDFDGSIECRDSECSAELVLRDDKEFTYNDNQIFMDGVDITSSLIDEILTITSKAEHCRADTCGFHVHISDGRPDFNLNGNTGKNFLLRSLALWCGIEGQGDGEQTGFITKGYVRPDNEYAALLQPLDKGEFKRVYDSVNAGESTTRKLLDYFDNIFSTDLDEGGDVFGPRYKAYNIYVIGEGGRVGRKIETNILQAAAEGGSCMEQERLSKLHHKPGHRTPCTCGRCAKLQEKCAAELAEATENGKKEYEKAREDSDLWNKPLRIEFRGHKDLMEKIMDNTDTSSPDESSVHAITGMMHSYDPEKSRNLAKASRFHDHLMTYLEDIDSLFERAKTYDPPI
jgi:hypothetical protein